MVCGARVLINTGTTPSVPPIEGLADAPHWTSEDLLALPELPDALVVLGGGVIGVEMASLMGLLGVPVTVVHAGEHILDREDDDVAAEVAAGLEALGVTILTGARASKVAAAPDGRGVVVTTADGREAAGSHLLVPGPHPRHRRARPGGRGRGADRARLRARRRPLPCPST